MLGSLLVAPGAAIADSKALDTPGQIGVQWQIDMPPQSVDEGIYRLGAVTGVPIFADGERVAGRRTRAISGSYTAAAALKLMLAGTGLVIRATGAGSLLVTEDLPGPKSEELRRDYSLDLQRTVVAALCRLRDVGLGQFRLALRMWLSEQGQPERVDLLSSSGDEDRDRRILETLRAVSVRPPPDALPQPVIMVMLPRSLQESGDCPDRLSPAGIDSGAGGPGR